MMFWELSGEFGKNPYACIPEPQFVSTICVMHWLQWGKPGIISMGKLILHLYTTRSHISVLNYCCCCVTCSNSCDQWVLLQLRCSNKSEIWCYMMWYLTLCYRRKHFKSTCHLHPSVMLWSTSPWKPYINSREENDHWLDTMSMCTPTHTQIPCTYLSHMNHSDLFISQGLKRGIPLRTGLVHNHLWFTAHAWWGVYV